jgi:subfamily B ATP-binding cassette protein MsbA
VSLLSTFRQRFDYLIQLLITTPRWGLICILQIFSGFASFLGLPLLIPVLEMMQTHTNAPQSTHYTHFLIPIFNTIGLELNFHTMLTFAAILILMGQLLVNVSSLTASYVREDLIAMYRKKILQDYALVDWQWLTEHHSARMFHAVTREAEQACDAHINAQRVFINFFQIIIFMVISFRISWQITLLALGVYVILGAFNSINSNIINQISETINQQFKHFSNDLVSFQHNKKFIKVALLGEKFIAAFRRAIDVMRAIRKRQMLHVELQRAWSMMGTYILLIVLIYFHQMLALNYATLLLVLFVFMRMAPQFVALSDIYATLDMNVPMHKSLQKHLDELRAHTERNGSLEFQMPDSIRFEHVRFSYINHPPVLTDLNVVFEPNTVTALVGKSGCGKSTILDVFLGLLSPEQGNVYYGKIDGVDLDKDSLRRHTAFVGQRPSLIDGTLRDNLTVAKPNATDDDIEKICQQVHLSDLIRQLPEGLNTIVGENGIKLSGGQRQKIALGRCLLLKPAILILDEATSELDSESEGIIQQTLRELRKEMTTIVVAHRLSTVKTADRIYVIAGGAAVEYGTYEELLARKGKFYDLLGVSG